MQSLREEVRSELAKSGTLQLMHQGQGGIADEEGLGWPGLLPLEDSL